MDEHEPVLTRLRWLQSLDRSIRRQRGSHLVDIVGRRHDHDSLAQAERCLDRVGHGELKEELKQFWPSRGPQWDALAISTSGKVLLVEAKAHVGEICSPEAKAKGEA